MACVKASLILLFLIVPIVRSSQVGANLSLTELGASDANTKYWLRMQNTVRTIGSPCSEDKCVEACPEGWEANGGHCYLWGDEKKNWTAAEDFCREEGGHLATVNTNDTKEFVLEGLARKNLMRTWIGGNDIREEGVWKWTDCTPWEDMFWAPGEPTNWTPFEDCLELGLKHPLQSHNRKFNNQNCNAEMLFLCSKKICSSDNLEEEETAEADNDDGGKNLEEEETTEADKDDNGKNLKEEETTEAENTNNSSNEEDTSGASVMWKLISSSFAVLLFLFF